MEVAGASRAEMAADLRKTAANWKQVAEVFDRLAEGMRRLADGLERTQDEAPGLEGVMEGVYMTFSALQQIDAAPLTETVGKLALVVQMQKTIEPVLAQVATWRDVDPNGRN
jgi:hypothetical protein